MKRNKGKEIFENATVQCQHCGRYLIRPMPHLCPFQLRKRHQKWLYLNEMKPEDKLAEDYKLIHMSEITDEAREIAVAWMECDDKDWIGQKHKLASDIMNYARRYHKAKLKEKLMKLLEWEGNNDIPEWVPLENIVDEYLKQREDGDK